MKFVSALFVTLALLSLAHTALAQDTRFRPDRQQIPTPGCLNMKGAWEGGSAPCTQNKHDSWLTDIPHCRDERKIRIGDNATRDGGPHSTWPQPRCLRPR